MARKFRILLFAVSALSGVTVAAAAEAQTTAAPAGSGQAASTTTGVQEVVVTAEKRSESVQKVPAAITALSAEAIQERGITQASDLTFAVPSLQAGTLLGNTNLVIRGVGLNLINTAAPPGVAIQVDGIYEPLPSMGDLDQIDLERVEVLRGPQGTLYGRNANGGVVNFITKAPTDKFEGYVQAGYASYNEGSVLAVVNIPINDKIRTRAVIDYDDRGDGFIKNVIPGGPDVEKGATLSGRLSVAADLADNLTFDLTAAQLHETGPQDIFVLHGFPTALSITSNPILATAVVPQAPNETSITNPTQLNRNSSFIEGTFTWMVGGAQIKSISGYQYLHDDFNGSEDGFNIAFLEDHKIQQDSTVTQEIDINKTIGPVDFIGGGFYMDENDKFLEDYTFPNGFGSLPSTDLLHYQQPSLETKAIAGFIDATWRVTDSLRLIGGVRVSNDKVTDFQYNYIENLQTLALSISCNQQTFNVSYNSTTPRASAQYDLSSDSNAYFTYSQGFKDGGFNRTTCGGSYLPERVTAYEIGTKNRFLNDTVTLNASAFYYQYTNLQLVQVIGLSSSITNAAAAEIKGVEVEGVWRPDSHWTVNANLSILDAQYTSYSDTDTLAPALGVQNVSGHYLNNAPKESANVGVSYKTDDLGFGYITFRGDISQKSKIFFREFNLPADSQAGYTVVNLAAIWDSRDGKYRVRVFANNVGNQGYLTSLYAVNNFGAYEASWGEPRQFGVQVRRNF